VELSTQVRGVALDAYARLRRQALPVGRLALNLSAAELVGAYVVDRLEQQVEAAGLDMYNLNIEITEDALLDRVADRTLARLAELRERGAKLGLDDFGTGTSGLAQLLKLPLDEIKLDRTFTQQLGRDGRAEQIVKGTIRLAESMRLTVVAEGVENAAQARALRALRCKFFQGWLFAPALPEAALREWLIAREPPVVVVPRRPAIA
jgi:EAL domain-containing protein (putative c-di-GMP-specific phosphodiesterase class I)